MQPVPRHRSVCGPPHLRLRRPRQLQVGERQRHGPRRRHRPRPGDRPEQRPAEVDDRHGRGQDRSRLRPARPTDLGEADHRQRRLDRVQVDQGHFRHRPGQGRDLQAPQRLDHLQPGAEPHLLRPLRPALARPGARRRWHLVDRRHRLERDGLEALGDRARARRADPLDPVQGLRSLRPADDDRASRRHDAPGRPRLHRRAPGRAHGEGQRHQSDQRRHHRGVRPPGPAVEGDGALQHRRHQRHHDLRLRRRRPPGLGVDQRPEPRLQLRQPRPAGLGEASGEGGLGQRLRALSRLRRPRQRRAQARRGGDVGAQRAEPRPTSPSPTIAFRG